MSTLIPRFALRLLLPALALGAIAVLGEPLPATAATESTMIQPTDDAAAAFSVAIEQEAEALRREALAARRRLSTRVADALVHHLSAASSKRCASARCAQLIRLRLRARVESMPRSRGLVEHEGLWSCPMFSALAAASASSFDHASG